MMFCYLKASFKNIEDCYYFDILSTRMARVMSAPDFDYSEKEPRNLAISINQGMACISNRLKKKKIQENLRDVEFQLTIDEEFKRFLVFTKEYQRYFSFSGLMLEFPDRILGIQVIICKSIPDLSIDREARRLMFGIPEDAC